MDTVTDASETAREGRLRRMARRQGLTLQKSRTRDPQAVSYGLFRLVDGNNYIVAGGEVMGFSLTLDEVESYLADSQGLAVQAHAKLAAWADDDREEGAA